MRATVIGTGHVFAIGDAVRAAIMARAPRVVCVELDPNRLAALRARETQRAAGHPAPPAAPRHAPLGYRLLARFQERLAARNDTSVGGEMVAALQAARDLAVPVSCIDVESVGLVRRVWREMGWRERARLGVSLLGGVFGGRGDVDREVARFERDPGSYLDQVAAQFPTAKRILIDERDEHMSRGLLGAATATGHALAVVGDGHVNGMEARLRRVPGLELEVIRLRQIRAGTVPPPPAPPPSAPPAPGSARVSFTTTWRDPPA